MIGYRCLLVGAIALAALAPTLSVQAASVSSNEVDYEDSVQIEEDNQSDDTDTIQSSVSDNDSDSSDDYIPDDEQFDTVSGNNFDYDELYSLLDDYFSGRDDGISLLSDYTTYYGSISSTYLEYMRGYIPKLSPSDHYVASRVGQYEYIFAYGENLVYDGVFSGSDVVVVSWYTQGNGTFSVSTQPSFSLSPGSYLVYTDLSDNYPSLLSSGDYSLRQIVIVLGIVVVFYTLSQFMKSAGIRKRSRRWKF